MYADAIVFAQTFPDFVDGTAAPTGTDGLATEWPALAPHGSAPA